MNLCHETMHAKRIPWGNERKQRWELELSTASPWRVPKFGGGIELRPNSTDPKAEDQAVRNLVYILCPEPQERPFTLETRFPPSEVAAKIAVSLGIGLLVGIERSFSTMPKIRRSLGDS